MLKQSVSRPFCDADCIIYIFLFRLSLKINLFVLIYETR